MHLAGDACTLRGGAELGLLVALTFQSCRLLVQGCEQLAALADHQAERRGRDGESGHPDPVLE